MDPTAPNNHKLTTIQETIDMVQQQYEKQINILKYELCCAIKQNLEFEEFTETQADEISDLNFKLVTTETVLAESEINAKRQSQELMESKEGLNNVQIEVHRLKKQLSECKKRQEKESAAWQELANEREQLLSDIQSLQRRNHGLVAASEKRESRKQKTLEITSGSETVLKCVRCSTKYKDEAQLLQHMQQCLRGRR